MTKGKTSRIQKYTHKEIIPRNYTLRTCLLLMRLGRKYITHQDAEICFKKKGCHEGTRRTGYLLHIELQILKEKNWGGKCSHDFVWQQVILWYGPAMLDSRLHKCTKYPMKSLYSSWVTWKPGKYWQLQGKNSCRENPETHLPLKCPFAITISKCNDPAQVHTSAFHWRLQTYYITRKD